MINAKMLITRISEEVDEWRRSYREDKIIPQTPLLIMFVALSGLTFNPYVPLLISVGIILARINDTVLKA